MLFSIIYQILLYFISMVYLNCCNSFSLTKKKLLKNYIVEYQDTKSTSYSTDCRNLKHYCKTRLSLRHSNMFENQLTIPLLPDTAQIPVLQSFNRRVVLEDHSSRLQSDNCQLKNDKLAVYILFILLLIGLILLFFYWVLSNH